MSTQLTIDKAGRIVIPKALREDLHLAPGDALEMDSTGEQITLRPLRGTDALRREQGVWILRTGQSLAASATEDLLRELRTERDRSNNGSSNG